MTDSEWDRYWDQIMKQARVAGWPPGCSYADKRGHPIIATGKTTSDAIVYEDWCYLDGVSTKEEERPCTHCGKDATPEGHDACLGTLPGVKAACCGHGTAMRAYVLFTDDAVLREQEAVQWFEAERGEHATP